MGAVPACTCEPKTSRVSDVCKKCGGMVFPLTGATDARVCVGAHVEKTGGDYRYEGFVVADFVKASGQRRLVVENADGMLFIFNPSQLRLKEQP